MDTIRSGYVIALTGAVTPAGYNIPETPEEITADAYAFRGSNGRHGCHTLRAAVSGGPEPGGLHMVRLWGSAEDIFPLCFPLWQTADICASVWRATLFMAETKTVKSSWQQMSCWSKGPRVLYALLGTMWQHLQKLERFSGSRPWIMTQYVQCSMRSTSKRWRSQRQS